MSALQKLKQIQTAMADAADYAVKSESNPGDRARVFVAGLAGAVGVILSKEEAALLHRVLYQESGK